MAQRRAKNPGAYFHQPDANEPVSSADRHLFKGETDRRAFTECVVYDSEKRNKCAAGVQAVWGLMGNASIYGACVAPMRDRTASYRAKTYSTLLVRRALGAGWLV